jgi:hypothetical protein
MKNWATISTMPQQQNEEYNNLIDMLAIEDQMARPLQPTTWRMPKRPLFLGVQVRVRGAANRAGTAE